MAITQITLDVNTALDPAALPAERERAISRLKDRGRLALLQEMHVQEKYNEALAAYQKVFNEDPS